ncbi:MAG: type I-C CRISPR-associated protein Cas8c/Csd1 [Candidatus Contendobacter sp.]|nr:MAG: type I-C CRISPR-associated protein Cas8c/Csd1 [Candidatus Contendobacter sp.]
MILQALCDYYRRQQEELPPPGFERKAIPFVIVLDRDGRFVDIEDTRDGNDKRDKGRLFVVPQGVKRASGVAANLLWDNLGYVLGVVSAPRAAKLNAAGLEREQKRTRETHAAFVQRIHDAFPAPVADKGVRAVLAFLERADFSMVFTHPLWPELDKSTDPLSFRLDGDLELICQREAVRQAVVAAEQNTGTVRERCLVSGNQDVIARLHPAIKGVRGAQSSGANLFSFNFDAACSHGKVPKDRGMNAPVGEYAAFAYTTALNYLLRADSRQKLLVGEDTFVFWAEKPDPAEELFATWLQPDPDDPARGVEAVKALYEAPKTGVRPLDEDETRFFVLGLAPNVARLAVRLWNVSTVRELATNIRRHFDDLAIVRSPRDLEYLPLWRLLVATAAQGKSENIPPLLAGEVLRAILAGTHYPQILLVAALQRIRAEQGAVNYVRAALIKAVLVRNARFSLAKQEVDVSLDLQNPNIGYRLGRLFAVLERAQELASPGLNATIRDRFYGAASATPVTAFPYLLKLKNHHVNKLATGQVIWLENLIGQILEAITHFPAHLNLDDQGRFAIGYYHQRQDFFTKKPSDNQSANQGAPDHG